MCSYIGTKNGGKNMKSKILSKVIALSLTSLVVFGVGCGTGSKSGETPEETPSGNGKEQTVLTVWAWDDNFNIPVIQKAGEYYAKVNPDVKVEVLSLSKEDVYSKLQTSLAGGGQGLPDIVLLEDYVSGKYLDTFMGSFADLTNELDYSGFIDFKKGAVSFEGKKYGIPFDTGATSLFYRLDYIEEAGYTEADMRNLTWEKYIEIGKAVKDKTGNFMTAEIAANKTSTIRTMMQSAGLWYFDKNGEINIQNNPALKEGMETLKEMKDAGILYDAESAGDRSAALNGGSVASIVNGPWFVGNLKVAEDQVGKWRVAETPKLTTVDSQNASNVGGSSWYILDKSPDKAEAIDLFKQVFTGNLDFYAEILVNQGALTGYKDSLEGEVFEKGDDFFGGQKIYELFADTLSKVPVVNYGGYVAEANDAINAITLGYFDGSISLDDALKNAEEQLKNQLGR